MNLEKGSQHCRGYTQVHKHQNNNREVDKSTSPQDLNLKSRVNFLTESITKQVKIAFPTAQNKKLNSEREVRTSIALHSSNQNLTSFIKPQHNKARTKQNEKN